MITYPPYKINAREIANVFCVDNTFCALAVKERLINKFNDTGFAKFLSNLSVGRMYEGEFKNYRVDNNTGRRYVNFVLTDVITGDVKTLTWNWLMSQGTFFSQIIGSLSLHSFEIIQGFASFDQQQWMTKRIYHKNNDPTYGIAYVPGSVGGGGSGGGGGTIIVPTPNDPALQQTQTETQAGAGLFAGLGDLPSWVLPVVIGVGGYFLLKQMKVI
jgi:hypothetical protein